MPVSSSPVAIIANVGAIAALVLMMLGVGLAVGPNLSRLPRALDRRSALLSVVANLLVVPGLCALLLVGAGPSSAVAAAILLLACFPAGPISLMFVRQDSELLVRSTATVLLLQFVSVVLSPLLLLGLGRLVLGQAIVARPRAAAISMASQMVFLEIAPIFVGAWLGSKLATKREIVRRSLRQGAMISLAVAGAAFASLYLDTFGSDWTEALEFSLALLAVSWVSAIVLRGQATHSDAAQIAGLRNVSLSIVVAGTTRGLEGAVVFVLLGAGVVTAGAPLLQMLRRDQLATA